LPAERFCFEHDTTSKTAEEYDRYALDTGSQYYGVPVRGFSRGSLCRSIEGAGLAVVEWDQFSFVQPEMAEWFAGCLELAPEVLQDMGISQYAIAEHSDPSRQSVPPCRQPTRHPQKMERPMPKRMSRIAGLPMLRASRQRALRWVRGEDVGLRDAKLSGWFQHESGELLAGFPIGREDVVLDVGCGDGQFARFAAERGADVIIADVDAGKIAAAEARLASTPARNVRALVTDASPLPLPDATASRVVAMEVLEHVESPKTFVAELVRVAKPGAMFLVSVPAQLSEEVQEALAPPSYFQRPNHVRIFKADELEQLLMAAGLIVERRASYGFYWAMWWTLFWICNQDVSDPWHPLLRSWERTWRMLLDTPQGIKTKKALDALLPKSQAIIARKPSAS
jgi:2-polyprenyl-3-methyl-5-hydroxy-6-metoxy-1,4-benzoquinol methylase